MERSCCDFNIEIASSMEFYKEYLNASGISENVLAAVVGILIIFITSVVWKLIAARKSKRKGILLLGLSDAGKTNLFTQLVSGVGKETQTSLKENTAIYQVEEDSKAKGSFSIVDIPGHEAIRNQYLERYKDQARGIIFVIDSETFQKNVQDVAEFLFRVFTDKAIYKISPSVCIACNKQDLLLAKSKKVIQTHLEKELNTVRKTQSAALTSTSGGGDDSVFLGVRGEEFKFQQLKKFKVEFLECNSRSSEDADVSVESIKSWIASLL